VSLFATARAIDVEGLDISVSDGFQGAVSKQYQVSSIHIDGQNGRAHLAVSHGAVDIGLKQWHRIPFWFNQEQEVLSITYPSRGDGNAN